MKWPMCRSNILRVVFARVFRFATARTRRADVCVRTGLVYLERCWSAAALWYRCRFDWSVATQYNLEFHIIV